MKQKKSWRKKTISSLVASSIMATSLLPAENLVHAEDDVAPASQSVTGETVEKEQKEEVKSQTEQKQEEGTTQESLNGKTSVEKPTDSLEQAEADVHQGLIGYYFKKEDYSDLSYIRESQTGYLVAELEEGVKSVYWHGYIEAETDGTYSFRTTANQHAIVTVNGERLIDKSDDVKTIRFEKGKTYEIDIQYVRKESHEAFQLYWMKHREEGEGYEFEKLVPTSQLTLPNRKRTNAAGKAEAFTASTDAGEHKVKIDGVQYEDEDGDGIPDEWEIKGYTVEWKEIQGKKKPQLVRWEDKRHSGQKNLFGKPYVKYVSDPQHKSTTRDPYSDYEKVMNKVHPSVLDVAKHPLVAALPVLQIETEDFSVSLVRNISTNEDKKKIHLKSKTSQTGDTTSKGWKLGASLGTEGPIIKSVGLNWGYGSSTTTHNVMETVDAKQNEKGWAKSIGYNSAETAYVDGSVRYNNVGTAPAFDIQPTLVMSLPLSKDYPKRESLATLSSKANSGQNVIGLLPKQTYPSRDNGALHLTDFSDYKIGNIALSEDQFQRFEKDQALQIDVTQYAANVTLATQKPEEGNQWNHYILQSNPVTARLSYIMPANQQAIGNQTAPPNPTVELLERRILGKPKNPENGPNRPYVNMKEAIELTSDLKITPDGYKYGAYTFKDLTVAFDKSYSPGIEQAIKKGSIKDWSDIIVEEGMNIQIVPKGWVKSEAARYYYDEQGTLVTGKREIENHAYYFDKKGKIHRGGWVEIEGKWYYFSKKDDGTRLVEDEMATGFKIIEGKKYYFGKTGDGTNLSQGQLAKGSLEIGNRWYQFNDKGEMISAIGWVEIEGKRYYFGKTGDGTNVPQGQIAIGWNNIEEKRYYFNDKGEMKTGFVTIEGKTYYFGKKGDNTKLVQGEMATGEYTIEGHTYFFNAEKVQLSSNKFVVGEMVTGWVTGYFDYTPQGNWSWTWSTRYYDTGEDSLHPKGSQATGWRFLGMKMYYFGKKGDGTGLAEGQMATGFVIIEGKRHYFKGNGEMEEGTGFVTIEGKTYYFGKKGDNTKLVQGEMATGFVTIEGKTYYFGKKGDNTKLDEGEMATGEYTIEGKTYFFNAEKVQLSPNKFVVGEMVTGWVTGYFNYTKQGNWTWWRDWQNRYYDTNGVKAVGAQEIDGKRYYFNGQGDWCQKIVVGQDGRLYREYTNAHPIFGGSKLWLAIEPKDHPYSTSSTRMHYLLEIDKDGLIIQDKKDGEAFYKWYKEHHTGNPENHEDGFTYEEETGFQEIDGKTYYFAESDDKASDIIKGDMIIGWDDIKDENGVERRYYFAEADDPDRQIEEGQMMTGF
ncbi:PA14 domain-containing protein, partial [Bacillus thuringiensis]|uniref:binary toxin-like calcium binding domain-containing protein n=1 Tax=Bacillus thuringiensis TaxID=1428 RepID=UPI003459095D